MLRDERFSSKAKVDRYGRKLAKHNANHRDLEKFYRIDQDSQGIGFGVEDGRGVEEEASEVEDTETSQSSSDDETSSDESKETEEEEVFGLLQQQDNEGSGIPKGEVSRRIAIVNLDWDHIRATDLMAVLSSFVSAGRGTIQNVAIYPSEFGKERIAKEEMEGPPKEVFAPRKADEKHVIEPILSEEEEDEDEEAEEDKIAKSMIKEDTGAEFNSAKLRRYQLERLRYFYAVVTCSSAAVAQGIYESVDGTEYLTTANFFDLRFVPDETDFSGDKPRDLCDQVPNGYKPTEFITDALQHSKVRLTWDADDVERKEAQKRAFRGGRKDLDENDLKAYLGSDSSEEEDVPEPTVVDATNAVPVNESDEEIRTEEPEVPKLSKKEAERQKMRALLGLPPEPASRKQEEASAEQGLQITFTSGLSEAKGDSVFEDRPGQAEQSTIDKYVRKEKERRAKRKDKMKVKRAEADNVDDPAEAAKPQQPPPKEAEEGDLGFDDPFFNSVTNEGSKAHKDKAAKKEKRRQREAEEAAKAAELERLESQLGTKTTTADAEDGQDDSGDDGGLRHFDMKALARAEKKQGKLNKKKKAKHLSQRDKEALEMKAKDAFEMDVGDERFRDLFERPEFAVDPSHPRFLGTAGMRKVLEEGRRRRKRRDEDEDGGAEEGGRMSRVNGEERKKKGNEDMERLVKRVKAKGGKR